MSRYCLPAFAPEQTSRLHAQLSCAEVEIVLRRVEGCELIPRKRVAGTCITAVEDSTGSLLQALARRVLVLRAAIMQQQVAVAAPYGSVCFSASGLTFCLISCGDCCHTYANKIDYCAPASPPLCTCPKYHLYGFLGMFLQDALHVKHVVYEGTRVDHESQEVVLGGFCNSKLFVMDINGVFSCCLD